MDLEGIVSPPPRRGRPRPVRGRDPHRPPCRRGDRPDGHALGPAVRDLRLARRLPPVRRPLAPRRSPWPRRSSPGTASGWRSRTTRTGGPTSWSPCSRRSAPTTSGSASTRATAWPCWKTRWRSSRRWPRWAFTTHLKDMGVEEYDRGFRLAEVPLGAGVLDLPRIVRTLRAARPEIPLNLEMITRDPLDVPCLDDRYWATFPDLPGRHLARALAYVRAHPPGAAPAPGRPARARGAAPGRGREHPPLPGLFERPPVGQPNLNRGLMPIAVRTSGRGPSKDTLPERAVPNRSSDPPRLGPPCRRGLGVRLGPVDGLI